LGHGGVDPHRLLERGGRLGQRLRGLSGLRQAGVGALEIFLRGPHGLPQLLSLRALGPPLVRDDVEIRALLARQVSRHALVARRFVGGIGEALASPPAPPRDAGPWGLGPCDLLGALSRARDPTLPPLAPPASCRAMPAPRTRPSVPMPSGGGPSPGRSAARRAEDQRGPASQARKVSTPVATTMRRARTGGCRPFPDAARTARPLP